MSPSCSLYTLLAALVTISHANNMVESVDGSFVPWTHFLRRAPTDGPLALRLKNYNNKAYVATVLMGTPPQQIQMCPSLSQNYISVASPPPGVSDPTYYQPANSASSVQVNASATVQTISGGQTKGLFVRETCTLQSATSADVKFNYNASVVLTDPSVTNDLYPTGARGILGYGLNIPSGSPSNASLLGTFLPPDFVTAVCGIEMNHMDDPVPDGIFTMGAVDSSAYTGNFTNVMVPHDSQTSWSIQFDEITFQANGRAQSMSTSVASIDLYQSGIQFSTDMASQIYSGIPGSQLVSNNAWSLPCNSKFSITLTFGAKRFTISERDTIVKLTDGTCNGVVTGGAQGLAQIGAPFMRNVYTQFGAEKASNGSVKFFVGFATKNLRQKAGSGAPRIVQNTGLFPMLAVALIAAILFL